MHGIVTTTSRKRLKLLRADQQAERDDDPEETARRGEPAFNLQFGRSTPLLEITPKCERRPKAPLQRT
jgi:hypothetical protein